MLRFKKVCCFLAMPALSMLTLFRRLGGQQMLRVLKMRRS